MLFVSCTFNAPKHEYREIDNPVGVKLDLNDQDGSLLINEGNDTRLITGNHKVKKLLPVTGFYFGDGIYRSFSYLGCLRSLEKKKIPINILSGSGIGLLIATLYAKYPNSSKIEWKIFKLVQELKEIENIYSKKWIKTVEDFIDSEFKKDRIENLKLTLIIPYYDSKKKSIIYRTRGPVSDALKSILNLNEGNLKNRKLSLILYQGDLTQKIKLKRSDILFVFDSILEDISFKNMDNNIWGIYKKYAGFLFKGKENTLNFYSINNDKIDLDDKTKIDDMIIKGEDFCLLNGDSFLSTINNWKNRKRVLRDERKNL